VISRLGRDGVSSTLRPVRLLFIGDVVGRPGREALAAAMPELRAERMPDLVVVNGENVAGGVGITKETAEELFAAGVDVITLGNHAYRHREVYPYLGSEQRILRPANFAPSNPGRGHIVVEAAGMRVAVINLSGQMHLQVERNPFTAVDELLESLAGAADAIVVDFHAELTSEKVAMGWHLDGRVAAVLGTHTHVPTADGRVLPGGTAYISDVGMTGSRAGVIGVRREQALEAFRTQMPVRFDTADEDVWLMGVAVEIGDDGLARGIKQILTPVPSP
jgi:2',3'-cyclic-nucleotide 2'-phosphodiesterase